MINEIAKKFTVAIVGGYVRDSIMNLEPLDCDYVVEANQEEFEFHFPELEKVGNSFPVYLCPVTKSEIALTRTERCVGDSYQSFECTSGVSIEEDLFRRDITICSIAQNIVTKEYIDPCNGIDDIKNKIIRVVNPDAFSEDPLRIYRICRFYARFADFTVEKKTLQLMKDNVEKLSQVTMERVQLELKKTYEQSETPSKFFDLLDEIGGLRIHFNELERAKLLLAGSPEFHPEGNIRNHCIISMDNAKSRGYSYSVAIAALLHDFGKIDTPPDIYPKHIGHENRKEIIEEFFARHKFDAYTMKLSKLVFKFHMRFHQFEVMKDIKKVRFVRQIPRHLREDFIAACNCDSPLTENQLRLFAKVCLAIDTAKIDIPKVILKKGKEVIDGFVENIIYHRFKEL